MTDQACPSSSCPICRSSGAIRHFEVRSPYRVAVDPYVVWRCPVCAHSWCEGDTSPALLAAIYSGAFHDTAQQSAGDFNGPSPVAVNARARARWMKSLGLSGRLLDVGAGAGFFVLAARQEGFEVSGIDLSPVAANKAEAMGVAVRQGDFLAEAGVAGALDVITLWDSLCGMTDPHACMMRVSDQLAEGGICILTVAAGQSPIARMTGRFWPLLIPPVNLHFFSRQSLERLLSEHGMRLTSYRAMGKRVAVRFVVQKLFRSLGVRGADAWVDRIIPATWSIDLNLGDIVTALAIRTGPPGANR